MNANRSKLNREQWLSAVMDEMRPMFKNEGYPLPKNIRVTCGFPSRRARSAVRRHIGESWSSKCSKDGTFEVMVSPVAADSVAVAATLGHELSHVAAGHDQGHKGKFVECIRAIGLEGPPTRTVAGDKFSRFMLPVLKLYGPYPHAELDVSPDLKVQSTRLVKVYCKTCNYVARVTRKWIDTVGAPICPQKGHGQMLVSRDSIKAANLGLHSAA